MSIQNDIVIKRKPSGYYNVIKNGESIGELWKSKSGSNFIISLTKIYWVNDEVSIQGGGTCKVIPRLKDAKEIISDILIKVEALRAEAAIKLAKEAEERAKKGKEYFLIEKSSVYDLGNHASLEAARKSDYCRAMSGGSNVDTLLVVCRAEAHEVMRQLKLKLSRYDNSMFKQ
jgi:hypothetical protein